MKIEMKKRKSAFGICSSGAVQTLTKYFLLIAILFVTVIFGICSENFFSLENIMTIFKSSCVVALLSLGSMIVMNAGDINFAVGAQMTLASAVIGRVLASQGFDNYWLAVLLAIGVSLISGLLCAVLVIKIQVPAFIATIGVQTLLDAFTRLLTNGTNLFSNEWPETFTMIGSAKVGVIPLPLIISVIIAAFLYFMMEKTRFGRIFFSVGRNRTAARQIGVNVNRYRCYAYLLCALLAAIAGVMQTSIANKVDITTGSGYLLSAISSGVLGATFLTPGKYNVPGTFIAAMINVIVRIGVVSMGASNYAADLVQGVILLIAVAMIALVREDGLPAVSLG